MGNEIYFEGSSKSSKSKINLERAFSAWANEGLQNYEGMNSSSSSSERNDRKNFSSNDESSSSLETYEETQEDNTKVPFIFYWKEGGKKVQLTGNFANWNQFFPMTQEEKGVFKLELNLPRQEIIFKFIVDDKWVYSNNYEKKDDGHSNINNYIDLKNIKIEKKKKNNNITKEKKNKITKETWCISKTREQMNAEAPVTPFHYQDLFRININSNQIIIGRSKFLNFSYHAMNDENNSYKKILYPPHVNIFHIILGCVGNKRYTRVGSYHRFQQKVITLIYYKPIDGK